MTVLSGFNLDAPFDFRGLHPDLPVSMYLRHLPHWRQNGATYFVTFRLCDALPQNKLKMIQRMRGRWELSHPHPRESDWKILVRDVTQKTERWLDEGYGQCHLRRKEFAEEMTRSILHYQEEQYFVSSLVVMPNHCHIAIRPYNGFELERILQSIKGVTSRFINRALGRNGSLWEQESFDRIIRDEEHLFRVVQYIGNNPNRAGLRREEWHRWSDPRWQAAGWGFLE